MEEAKTLWKTDASYHNFVSLLRLSKPTSVVHNSSVSLKAYIVISAI